MPDQQTRLNRFMDEAAIRNVIALFADSATRGDYDMFRNTWAEDAEFIIGKAPQMQSATGIEDVVAMLRRLRGGKDFFVQFALPGVIEIDGDEAKTGPWFTSRHADLARNTTGTIVSPLIACGARTTIGCS